MNGEIRYESNKLKSGSIVSSPDPAYDLLLSAEDSALFGKINECMKGVTDIEDVKGDPDYKVANDAINEMISGYGKNITPEMNNEKFIRGSLTEETLEKDLINEIYQIKHEINSSNLNDISLRWVNEWRGKSQGGDAKTEEIREFIISSLDQKEQLPGRKPDSKKKRKVGRFLIIRYISLAAALVAGAVLLIRSLLPTTDPQTIFSKYYEPYSAVSDVTRTTDATENDSFAKAIENYKSGDYQAAAAGFSEAMLDKSTSLSACFFLGITELEMGKYESAIEQLDGIANRQGEYAKEAMWYIGLTYIKTGNKEKAYGYFEVLARSPGFYSDRSEKILRCLK